MNADALKTAMSRIDALLRAGDFQQAHRQLEILIDTTPDFADARRLLAGTKLALGDAAGAEQVLREAISQNPDWTPSLGMLGELLLNQGRREEAEQLLSRAAVGPPAYPRAALVLARYYNDSQRPAQALAVVEPYCAGGTLDAELAGQHVAALSALGRTSDAISRYQQLIDTKPHDVVAGHALALALQSANRHDESERIARRVLAKGHRSAALLCAQARSLVVLGKFDAAESALRDCLKLEPNRSDAHSDLARLVWMRSGDISETTAALDQALQTFANDDALWAARASILQGAGDPREAYASLEPRVVRAQAPPALLVRAGLAALEFDPGAALLLAKRAMRSLPNDTAVRKLLVAAQLGVGEARDALPHCQALLAAAPDDQYLIALQTTAWRLLDDERYAQYCDYGDLVFQQTLEVPSGWTDMRAFLDDLKRSLARLHDAHRHPLLFQSLRHGTETTEDLTHVDDPVIRALFAAFDAPIIEYMQHIGRGPDPLRRRNRGDYRFNGSWSVRLHAPGYHNNHVHPRGWISSACYIDLPDVMSNNASEEGVLRFGEPSLLTEPPSPPQYAVRPQPGMLVLFPSYFWHGTVPFSGGSTRLTVAFDAVPGDALNKFA